jgi:hypothetical protein
VQTSELKFFISEDSEKEAESENDSGDFPKHSVPICADVTQPQIFDKVNESM